jgi:hypothetical protein
VAYEANPPGVLADVTGFGQSPTGRLREPEPGGFVPTAELTGTFRDAALQQGQKLALLRARCIGGVGTLHFMAGAKKNKHSARPKASAKPRDPEWAAGLKRL